MSLKDLFGKHSSQILSSADVEKLEKDVESHEYVQEKIKDNARFIPRVTVDFEDPSTFARYGSAQKYYEDAVAAIINTYPYDGSLKEKLEWHNDATYIDNWIFESKYPRTTGYVTLNSENTAATATVDGHIHISTSPNYQYIDIDGKFNVDPNTEGKKLSKIWDSNSNTYDPTKQREINLFIDAAIGNTVEFWWKKDENAPDGYECLFDLWNGLPPSDVDYGRFLIEHNSDPQFGPAMYGLFDVTYKAQNSGVIRSPIWDSQTRPSDFDITEWNHYAITCINTTSDYISTKLYVNGKLVFTLEEGASINGGGTTTDATTMDVGSGIKARIAAYQAHPTTGVTGAALVFDGALRGSIDEFRYWKKARTSEEIGRHWFTQVGGGTNSDDSNVELGVYYKFNEGKTAISALDQIVLDYSGRISNSKIENYSAAARSTSSAIEESAASKSEFKDPILYSNHPEVQDLIEEITIEGSTHDGTNNSSIYNSIPEWIRMEDEEGERSELLNLTQVLASYFDTLHLQIEALPKLTNTDYVQDGAKPLPFAKHLLESVGMIAPEIFIDATVMESLLDRNEEMVFEEELNNVKNLIYQNIYNNIAGIYKSKGTEKSFRNLLHCFGIGDRLIKINLYGDNVTYKLEDNTKSVSVRKNYLDFNNPDRFDSTLYQEAPIKGGGYDFEDNFSGATSAEWTFVNHWFCGASATCDPTLTDAWETISATKALAASVLDLSLTHEDSYNINVPTAAGGLGATAYVVLKDTAPFASTPSADQIFVLADFTDNPAVQSGLILAINGTTDTTKVKYGSNITNGQTVGILGIDAEDDDPDSAVILTTTLSATTAGEAGNEIAINQTIDGTVEEYTLASGGFFYNGSDGSPEYKHLSIWTVEDDRLHLTSSNEETGTTDEGEGHNGKAMLNDVSLLDAHIEVDVEFPEATPIDGRINLMLRHQDDSGDANSNGWYQASFVQYGDNAEAQIYVKTFKANAISEWSSVVAEDFLDGKVLSSSSAYKTIPDGIFNKGESTKLAFRMVGDVFSVYINGVQVISGIDTNLLPTNRITTAGSAGISAYLTQEAFFDNLKVSAYPFSTALNYIPFTLESEVIFPKKLPVDHPESFSTPFTDISLFGMHEADPANDADLSYFGNDACGFKVWAVKEDQNSSDVKFKLEATSLIDMDGVTAALETDIIKEVYDNEKWNFAVRIKVNEAPLADNISGPAATYDLEFYGVNIESGVIQRSFDKTIQITSSTAQAALNASKRVYAGAETTGFTGAVVNKSDIKVGSVRYWQDYLDNDTIDVHARDVTNYGTKDPYKQAYFSQTSTHPIFIPQVDTLALHWNFETVSVDPAVANFPVEDASSITTPDLQRYGWLGDIIKKHHAGRATSYEAPQKAIDRDYIFTSKQQLPEILNSSDTINILTEEDEIFTQDSRPINHFWAIEKSMYQTISDEIINVFSTITSFNDLIGSPVNRYRMEYKSLGKLRQLFFERVEETPNIEKYIEFYKWLDSAIGRMIQELVPASANISDEMRTVIESHILERNKYWTKFPTLDSSRADGRSGGSNIYETTILGISSLLSVWIPPELVAEEAGASLSSVSLTNSTPISGIRIAAHAVTHEESASDELSSVIAASSKDSSRLYAISARNVEGNTFSGVIEPNSLSKSKLTIEKSYLTSGYTSNPTPIVPESIESINTYEAIQISGRTTNNRWFIKKGGFSSSDLTSTLSPRIAGHYDYELPDHTEFGKSKHVFVERFSAPGSSYSMPTGMLDIESVEFSAYNSINYRNLNVRRYLRKWLTEHFVAGETDYGEIEGSSIFVSKTTISSGGFHKIPKNTRYVPDPPAEASGGVEPASSGDAEVTVPMVEKYDNFWKQQQIPSRGHQYHWIASSIQKKTGLQGYASNHLNVGAQYPAIDIDPSSTNYGKVSTIRPIIGKTTIQDVHSHTYEVDENGNGITSTDSGHYHEITNWKLSSVCEQQTVCLLTDCNFTLGTPICTSDCTSSVVLAGSEIVSYHTGGSGVVTTDTDCHKHAIPFIYENGFPFLNLFRTIGGVNYEHIRIIDKNHKEVFFDPRAPTLEGNYILGDDIFSDDIWEKYENGSTTLNELLLSRSGPYQHSSWQQIRNTDNPMVKKQRQSNVASVVNTSTPSDISAIDLATNYIEPTITWNKPMSHEVSFSEGDDAILVHTYSNNIEVFVNNALQKRINFTKSTEQMYELLKKEYGESIKLKNVKYSEQIFPTKNNVVFLGTRVRLNYKESAGFDDNGYDRRSTDIRTFWKDKPLDRQRTTYDNGDYTTAALNAFSVSMRDSSVWALDYHRHKSEVGETSLRDGHTHTYIVDKNGNGVTSVDDSHFHTIANWQMLDSCECNITDCSFGLSTSFCESSCPDSTSNKPALVEDTPIIISDCHAHLLATELIMRGDLAWAGYAQTRGFVYNSVEADNINELHQGGPSEEQINSWAAPRPALQYIHNPNTMKAKEEGWAWDAGTIAANAPWQDSYKKYNSDIKSQGKEYSLIPEYRVSEHMNFYINDNKGNFRVKVEDIDIFELPGVTGTLDSTVLNSYSITDSVEHIEKITTDHSKDKHMLRIEVDAIVKLLPYNGFYPSQRSVQLGGLFYDSVIPHVTGAKDNVEAERARTVQAALQPYFAPGILFNSIKSGIAVDWAAYAGKYDGGSEEVSMRDKFLGRSFISRTGMKTAAGDAVMKRAEAAWTRDVKLGIVNDSDRDNKERGFNSYYCSALNCAGKQYNRLFNIVSQECNTRDFITWANNQGLDPKDVDAQNNFRQHVCGDSKWNYNPAKTAELFKTNVESLLGKDIIPSSNNNPNSVKLVVSTILSELETLPEQAPDISNSTAISERDLEGAYMDFTPNKRIPFEGLVSISKGLSNLDEDQAKIFYTAPSYYLERFESGDNLFEKMKHCDADQDLYNNLRYPYFEWDGDSTALYELAMHNFLAEVPNFFMKNKKFTTFESVPENKFKEAEIGKTYYMDVSLYKQGDFDMTLSPFDGVITAVKGTPTVGDVILADLSGNRYTTQGRYFGPALRYKPLSTSNKDNFYIGDPAQAAYTPPYFYGRAIARLSYVATKTNPSLNDILSNLNIEYINTDLDKKFASHSSNNSYVNTPAYQGRMPLESSINIKGKTKKDVATTDGSEVSSWTISPRFESPVLNFNTDDNKDIIVKSALDGKPRGIGMWSGYGEIPKEKDGLYFELLDSFPPEEDYIMSDTTKYVIAIGIPSDVRSINKNIIQLFEPLKDSTMATSEINIGQPSIDGEQIHPKKSISTQQAEYFGLSDGTQFYHSDARIRTAYTSEHSTKDNPTADMREYDVEAYFEAAELAGDECCDKGQRPPASNLVPKSFDIANAICYHINYNNQISGSDYNWRASVKWVSNEHRSNIVGASLDTLSDNDPAYKDDNLTGFGAVVEIEWIRPEGFYTTKHIPEIKLVKGVEKEGLRCLKPADKAYKADSQIGFSEALPFYSRITSSKGKETPSGYGSLIDLCGFSRDEIKSKIGEVALEKDISEAIVMIPFVDSPISSSEYASTIKVEGKNFFSISDTVYDAAEGESISNMKTNMQKYNLPPHYDFAKYSNISPFVMYVFEFTEKLDQDDLSNIWQGVMPTSAKRSTKYDNDPSDKYSNKQVIEHELNENNFFEGKKLPPTTNPIKWMTFKVKKRANIDYYNVTSDTTDDDGFKFSISGESLKPDYSYNWPYDYFSLVELAKVNAGVKIVAKEESGEDEE